MGRRTIVYVIARSNNIQECNRENPFLFSFGTEAMIPTEIMIPTTKSCLQKRETNNQDLASDLGVVNELWDSAKIRMATYQQWSIKSYNKNVRVRRFQVGDLILRKAFQNTTDPKDGKLAPKWEGPYRIEVETGKGSISVIRYGWKNPT
ncbi:uncharacterized protein LOC143562604 [Bidens hawaiensis]|uniref:uncharacterized protein LOC143562604 n=1 Tax=Bidens hawaiensis TaxID=980011 RepID=UPI004049AF67